MKDHLNRIENVTLWEIICTIYSIAVSCKELNDDVTTTEKRKNEPPKWITSIENSINRITKIDSSHTSCNKVQKRMSVYETSKNSAPNIKKEIR